MSTSSVNPRRHGFCEKHPIAVMILLILGTYFLLQLYGIISAFIVVVFKLPTEFVTLFTALLNLLTLAVFKWWFRPDFEGFFQLHIDMKELMTLSLPFIIYWIAVSLLICFQFGFSFTLNSGIIFNSALAGIGEEVILRGVTIPVGMRFIRNKGRIVFSAVLTSVLFGAAHSSNALAGADLGMTVLQVIATIFTGLMLATVFLRSGSILPCMILHFFTDLIQFILTPNMTSGLVTYSVTVWNLIDLVICVLLFGIAAYYFLRPEAHDVIYAIWNRKWNQPMEACPLSRDE